MVKCNIIVGDVLDVLSDLPADHYDCVVTSPPYWGLRDYGVAGQIGLEPSLGEHLDVMVRVFRAVRRVLKPSGTLWLNYGDCYAAAPNGRSAADTKAVGADDRTFRDKPISTVGPIHPPETGNPFPAVPRRGGGNAPAGPVYVPAYERTARVGQSDNLGSTAAAHGGRIVGGGQLKPRDLCMIPNRLAIALQDDGWWVRSEIIWAKPNAMPDSSGRFRPATAHEKWFLLTKSDVVEYWTARDTGEISAAPDLSERVALHALEEDGSPKIGNRWIGLSHYYNAAAVRVERAGNVDANGFRGGSYVDGVPGPRAARGNKRAGQKMPDGWNTGPGAHGNYHPEGREKGRTEDKQRGHSRRHAGFSDRWDGMSKPEQQQSGRLLRNYEPAPLPVWSVATRAFRDAHFATFPPELVERCLAAGCPPGGRVLDPFGGAGTVGMVAETRGLESTLIELNPAYAAMARARIDALHQGPVERAARKAVAGDAGPLFGGEGT